MNILSHLKNLRQISFVETCCFLYIFFNLNEGILRWIFVLQGAPWLIYLRDAFLIIAGICAIYQPLTKRDHRQTAYLGAALFFLIVWMILGSLLLTGWAQSLFGFKLFLPTLVGMAVGPRLLTKRETIPVFAFFWLIALSGVILSRFIDIPWADFAYTIGDTEVEGQRQWSIHGTYRLGGFSRASFEAGIQIGFLGMFLVCRSSKWLIRLFVILLSGWGLYLTTSRSAVIGMGLALTVWSFLSCIKSKPARLPLLCLPLLSPAVLFIGCAIPEVARYVTTLGGGGLTSTSSFNERAETVWRDGLSLLDNHGSIWFGRGIGGIGGAQKNFEINLYNPADNFALYMLVTFGVVGTIFIFGFFIRRWYYLLKSSDQNDSLLLIISSFCIGVGVFLNCVENGLLSFLLGSTMLSLLPRSNVSGTRNLHERRRGASSLMRAALIRPLSVILLILPVCAQGQFVNLSPFVLGVGLQAGTTPIGPTLERIAATGCKSIRTDIFWNHVEMEKGRLVMPGRYLEMINNCNRLEIDPIVILDYSNLNYGGSYPLNDEALAAYQRFAEFVVTTFAGKIRCVEIWNEWNWGAGVPKSAGKGTAEGYVRLISQVEPALHRIDPKLLILGGGMAFSGETVGDTWLREALTLGLARHIGGLSIHPYCFSLPLTERTPEVGFRERLQNVSSILKDFPDAAQMPIYITEIGWPNHTGKSGTPPNLVAQFLPRCVEVARSFPNCRGIWWYNWRDNGTDPANKEHNFGLNDFNDHPKPALQTFHDACEKLSGTTP